MNIDIPLEIVIPGLIIGAITGLAFPTGEQARPWAVVLAVIMVFVVLTSGFFDLVGLINLFLADLYATPILAVSIVIGFLLVQTTQLQRR